NLVRSGKWQGLEENGIDKTENGRGAADAQRQGQNRRCGESGAFADHSQPEAHILAQLVLGPHLDWTACGPAGQHLSRVRAHAGHDPAGMKYITSGEGEMFREI